MADCDLSYNRVVYTYEDFKKRAESLDIEPTEENYKIYDKILWSLVDGACEIAGLFN